MIGTGIIGVGHLGRYHGQKYASNARARLLGVYDQDRGRAEVVAGELGCRVFDTVEELLGEVHAVSIVTPTVSHHALTRQALEAGVHCLVEKPFTTTLEEADDLVALAESRNLVLAAGHIKRAHPAIRHLRARGYGAPRYLEAERLAPFKPRSLDIDVIMDLMIHDLDLALYLCGRPITEVRAVGVPVVTDKVDMANAWLTLEGGAVANLAASRVAREPVRRLRLFWADRYASVDFMANTLHIYGRGGEGVAGIPGVQAEVVALEKADALADEVDDFLSAIGGGQVFCDGRAGRAALAAALGVRSAVEAGRHPIA